MSEFEVKIHRLVILPHPNADALELAVVGGVEQPVGADCMEVVGGFRAIVGKGVYKTGDYALYIPEAALLPMELVLELGLNGRLSGSGRNRVKAVKLRGELSQGIVCRPAGMKAVWNQFARCDARSDTPSGAECAVCTSVRELDYAEFLGITKYVPRVPAHFAGKIRERGTSRIVPWIEIPNIKKVMRDFTPGEPVIATEKVHGTHCMITWDALANDGAGELLVSSKGLGKQGFDLIESEDNIYWRAVRQCRVEEFIRGVLEVYYSGEAQLGAPPPLDRIAIYGEVYGAGVQDLQYGEKGISFRIFDMRVLDADSNEGISWVPAPALNMIVAAGNLAAGTDIRTMPILYRGPYDYDAICEVAQGDTSIGSRTHMREGVVVRPLSEREHGDGSRVIAKFINPEYLLRDAKKATEFE